MADTIQSVLVGGVAGFVSAVITYFSTRFRTRLELTAESCYGVREFWPS
jgi:hypothetical protein